MDPEPDEEAAALVSDLVQAARVPAKRRPFAVKPTVARLAALAYEHGLRPDALWRLVVDVLATPGGHLDQASLGALIRNLYPAGGATGEEDDGGGGGGIGEDVVLAVVGALGQGALKPPLAVQALLLRWLVLAYPALSRAGAAALARSYAVLFNLLDTAGIRPQLCHVLALITRRRHVRPFRIQAILQLSRQTGHDPHLLGLLRVFKNYYPEVIVGEATRGRASPFKHPDPQWRERLEQIRLARRQNRVVDPHGSGGLEAAHSGFRVRQDQQLLGRSRTSRNGGLPAVHTARAHEQSVTLEEVDGAAALAQSFDKIELPNQLVAVLADPLLQKLLLLRPSAEAAARVEHWLAAVVSSAAGGDGRDDELLDLLEVVHDYVASTNTFPPVFHSFFNAILKHWNGREKKELLLEALAYLPLSNFQETYESTFRLLEAKLLDSTVASQLDLLSFYTLLLQRWAASLAVEEENTTDSAESAMAARRAAVLLAVVRHVNGLVLAVLQNSAAGEAAAAHVSTRAGLAVLDFYEEVTAVLTRHRHDDVLAVVQEVIPPPAVVYTLHFHHSAAVAARLYAVLAAYKQALEAAMARRPGRGQAPQAQKGSALQVLTSDERARVNLFNGYLMDLCNCLWRARAFAAADLNAQGCRTPPAVVAALAAYMQTLDLRDVPLAAAFSLSHAPALCLHAASYLRQLEEAAMEEEEEENDSPGRNGHKQGPGLQRRHAGPVTQAALQQLASTGGLSVTWQAYRAGLLVYLEERGLGGVSALMHNTMKNLMNSRASGNF